MNQWLRQRGSCQKSSRQLFKLELLSEPSDQPSSLPSEPAHTPDTTASAFDSANTSQVENIDSALNTAKVLGRLKRGYGSSKRDSPKTRQILERTLKNNLERKLRRISLVYPPDSENLSLLESSQSRSLPSLEINPPRTSSPCEPQNILAPRTPLLTPSGSLESVFVSESCESSIHRPESEELLVRESQERSFSPCPSVPFLAAAMSELNEAEKRLKKLLRTINATIEANPIDILTEIAMIPLYVESEKTLVSQLIELNVGVAEIFDDHPVLLGDTKINSWKAQVSKVKSDLSKYRQNLATKIRELQQPTNSAVVNQPGNTNSSVLSDNASGSHNSSVDKERLDFEKEKLKKQQEKVQTEAERRMKSVVEDATKFSKKFPQLAEEWTLEENVKIEEAMKNIVNWEKTMSRLKKESREVEILFLGNKLSDPESNLSKMLQTVTSAEKLMDNSINQVQLLDTSRNLNSLGTRKVELVKLPQFSGKVGEDFVTFRRKMEKAFISNRIATDDQVQKLRENLFGGAKLIVPEGMDDIDSAWEVLEAAFGGEDKVMQNRKDKLADLGSLPDAGVLKAGQSKRVTWCLELERLLADIVELGNRSDALAKEAFSKSTINLIIGLFPSDIRKDMIKAPGEGYDKLLEVIDIIETERAIFQVDDQFVDKRSKRERSKAPIVGNTSSGSNPRGYQVFRGPVKQPNCRICKCLESRGDTYNLYENHVGNYPTGCPRFAGLTTEERFEITKEAKMCLRCLDPKSTWVQRDGHKNCQISKTKKNRFSCTNDRCVWHSWICSNHKEENKDLLNKFSSELSKRGLTFAQFNMFSSPALKSNNQPQKIADDVSIIRDTSKDLTREQAIEKLLKLTPNSEKLVTEERGAPMFMFGYAEGKTRPINIMYDSGCSDLLLKEGVPGKELEGIRVASGPFVIGAVGGVKLMANAAWMVKCKMFDGVSQVLEGLSVNQVTSDFPNVCLDEAIAAIKGDDKQNKLLQNAKVPNKVGGQVDILIGIKYNALFPTLIHMLPNGLGIYKLRIKSHGSKDTAVIAGPHSSFDQLLKKVGNMAYLLQTFQKSVQCWRSIVAPKIKELEIPPMSEKDELLAFNMNSQENKGYLVNTDLHFDYIEPVDEVLDKVFRIPCPDCDLLSTREEPDMTYSPVSSGIFFPDGYGFDHTANAADLTISKMKQIVEAQDKGLQIDYKCPKCRRCVECLKPIETERISLREEAEMAEISESVKLDLENKRIICSLPLRGAEEEFLSTNRAQAEKVLKQQCAKYFKDEQTKPIIIKAFRKLFDNKHAKLLKDLPPEVVEKILSKKVNYFIPWRVVFKDSISTPARPVLDASSNTPIMPDGTGGRSLNDACMKGRIPDMNLLRMILRFMIGKYGFTGDLSQFYNCFKLIEDNWNLQLFLWKEDLNPANETLVAVLMTLIYGVKCVAAQSEAGIYKLAKYIEGKHPELAEFLINSRYVDDSGDSKAELEECQELTGKANDLFAEVGMQCKEWSYTSIPPSEKVSADGRTVSIGGMYWSPEMDTLEAKIPTWHFGSVCRGRIKAGTETFQGSSEIDMNNFVPKDVTPRQISSKYYSFYDLSGLFLPLTAGMKRDLRRVMKETDGWDCFISSELRSKWVSNIWTLEKLKGMKFVRAKMPEDAVNEKMRMIVKVDAAKMLIIVAIWVGFPMKSGKWSCSYLIGRALLTAEDSMTPKDELNGLTGGCNMGFIVREGLDKWVDEYLICCDSTISLFWVKSDKLKLSIFHRNRVVQIRRTTDLQCLYHVVTDQNLADLPTRPDKVSFADVEPLSVWHTGLEWMKSDISEAVKNKILTPLDKLCIQDEQKADYDKGFVFEKTKDILTKGHVVTTTICGVVQNKERVDLVYSRAAFAKYIVLPTKYHFPSVVRIVGIVFKFIRSFKCRQGKSLPRPKFQMLVSKAEDSPQALQTALLSRSSANTSTNVSTEKYTIVPNEDDVSDALSYLFRVATQEVKEFVKPEILKKVAIESNGILYSKSRVMDGQRFMLSGDLEDSGILAEKGVIIHTPLVERFSPLAYSIGHWIHDTLSKHSGYETAHRTSLGFCCILKGASLYEEIAEDCTTCKKLRRKFIEVSMGPISGHQFAVCPPFWVTQADLYGPLTHYVPGRERNTRNKPSLDAKCYVFVMVCMVTKLVNMQVVETKDVGGISCALTRLGCEVGMPKLFLIDEDSGIMATLKQAEIEMVDASLQVYKEHGVRFETCPVAGHNAHGLVERKIKTAQELMEKSGFANVRMHTTGLQTTCKLVENMMNNTPYGFSYARGKGNNKLMKLISPNMMKIGRIHSRSLNGPLRLPEGPATIMKKVEEVYKSFYKIYNDTMVAKLIQEAQPKWFRNDRDLKVDDVVFFRKSEGSAIKGSWTVGMVDSITYGADGLIREAAIKYCNASEQIPRYTTRAVRSLVRLFNVMDGHWRQDMEEVQKMLRQLDVQVVIEEQAEPELICDHLVDDTSLCSCCCPSHCSLSLHTARGGKLAKEKDFELPIIDVNLEMFVDHSEYKLDQLDDYLGEESSILDPEYEPIGDCFMGLVTALNRDLSLA